jgi:hypothetical protein
MKAILARISGVMSVAVLLAGSALFAAAASTVVAARGNATLIAPTCDGLACGPCGSKCVCNTTEQICLDNT